LNRICDTPIVHIPTQSQVEQILETKNEPGIVAGQSQEYLKLGMHQQFSNAPEILPPTGNNRDTSIIELEGKHVDLYDCDKYFHKFSYWLEVLTQAYAENSLDQSKKDLIELIQRLPDAEAQELSENPAELLRWVYHQMETRVYNDLVQQYGQDYAYQKKIDHKKELNRLLNFKFEMNTPGMFNSNLEQTVASKDVLSNYSISQLEELSFNFKQGHQYINGTHRAFYLQSIAEQRSSGAALSQTSSNLLPIVIDKVVEWKNQIVFLDNIVFTPNSARLDIFFILDTGSSGNKAVFELRNVGFGLTGVPGGELVKLLLVNDIGIR